MLNDLGIDIYVPVDGQFVSQEHLYIAEILNDYDPCLSLAWIPADKREPGEQPFAVVHRPLGGPEYVVFYADQCDQRILERLWSMDMQKQGGAVLSNIEANNAAIEAIKMKKQMEEMEEAHELSASILKSKKNTYRHDGKVYQ
jgi:hypothetical protein